MAEQNILIVGAGRIGRSFIGQLFGKAGYDLVFVDMDGKLVNALNARGSYPVVLKGPDTEELIMVEHVRAIHASEQQEIVKAIASASIMAVSVGKSALASVAPIVSRGLLEREERNPGIQLDIILAENMRSANQFFHDLLKHSLPPSYPLVERVGLVETSIGKMVPIMTAADLAQDPLQIFAEPYNTLILDKKGFRGQVPDIPELALKENMKAWVDRKAFIHNLGHSTAAYTGYLKFPDAGFMYEVLADEEVLDFTRNVMWEAARILLAAYPHDFTLASLVSHINDLLSRFQNQNLGDTVFRVGCDLHRKLGKDDRFMGIIRLAEETGLPCDLILKAMAMGFHFQAKDENGRMFPGDKEFHRAWSVDRESILERISGLKSADDQRVIDKLMEHYGVITPE